MAGSTQPKSCKLEVTSKFSDLVSLPKIEAVHEFSVSNNLLNPQ